MSALSKLTKLGLTFPLKGAGLLCVLIVAFRWLTTPRRFLSVTRRLTLRSIAASLRRGLANIFAAWTSLEAAFFVYSCFRARWLASRKAYSPLREPGQGPEMDRLAFLRKAFVTLDHGLAVETSVNDEVMERSLQLILARDLAKDPVGKKGTEGALRHFHNVRNAGGDLGAELRALIGNEAAERVERVFRESGAKEPLGRGVGGAGKGGTMKFEEMLPVANPSVVRLALRRAEMGLWFRGASVHDVTLAQVGSGRLGFGVGPFSSLSSSLSFSLSFS